MSFTYLKKIDDDDHSSDESEDEDENENQEKGDSDEDKENKLRQRRISKLCLKKKKTNCYYGTWKLINMTTLYFKLDDSTVQYTMRLSSDTKEAVLIDPPTDPASKMIVSNK